jgi:pyrroline-5-carboxylate reductase
LENDIMSLQNKTISFIGAGNMAEALIRGLLATGAVQPQQLIAADVQPARLEFLAKKFGIRTGTDNTADAIVFAVKPQQMSGVLTGLQSQTSGLKLLISIAAGIPTSRIERELTGSPRVVRVMPNTPALVGAGAAALCKGRYATDDDLATAEAILSAVGVTVRVEEQHMDAVTALSGSGPAYVFYVTEAMVQAGIHAGLSPELSKQLALQTVYGAAKLMVESAESPETLRRKVTSPGGTTEAALKVMAERKLIQTFVEAVQAATNRGRELSAL